MSIPFDNFIQSPIGLVPKSGGKTRLIFHLSYNFSDEQEGKSLNYHTPRDKCTVNYNDLDTAVDYCLRMSERSDVNSPIFLAKSDMVECL